MKYWICTAVHKFLSLTENHKFSIIKQKQKLLTLKEERNKGESLDERYRKSLNDMTLALEKKYEKVSDLEQKTSVGKQ